MIREKTTKEGVERVLKKYGVDLRPFVEKRPKMSTKKTIRPRISEKQRRSDDLIVGPCEHSRGCLNLT